MNSPFNPDMLILGRELRGLTQSELVRSTAGKISQGKLSKIENGLVSANDEDVKVFASALRVRETFFYLPHRRRAEPPTYHRKRQKLSKSDWARIYATAELHRISAATLLRSVELTPKLPSAPSIDREEYAGRIEEIANHVRGYWSVARGPIPSVTQLLENAGVIVCLFDFGTELCDGFSQHGTGSFPPVIFANSRQPIDRLRFTLAHELGHIVMHSLPNPNMEDEANRFAAEFLMPTSDIVKDFYNLSLERFMSLKVFWRSSMHSLVYKAHKVGRLTESNYRYYLMQMSKKGWRTKEPIDVDAPEKPRILDQVVRAHLNVLSYNISDLSTLLGLYDDELGDRYGLIERPRLKLVVG